MAIQENFLTFVESSCFAAADSIGGTWERLADAVYSGAGFNHDIKAPTALGIFVKGTRTKVVLGQAIVVTDLIMLTVEVDLGAVSTALHPY